MGHRHGLRRELLGEGGVFLGRELLYRGNPLRIDRHLVVGQFGQNGVERACEVSDNRCVDVAVAVDFCRLDIELYELAIGIPLAVSA